MSEVTNVKDVADDPISSDHTNGEEGDSPAGVTSEAAADASGSEGSSEDSDEESSEEEPDEEVSEEDKMNAYAATIEEELAGGSVPRIQTVFEMAVEEFPHSENLWLRYATWLDSLKISSLILPAYERACKFCPDCSALWQQYLLAFERSGSDYRSEILPHWPNAKKAIQNEEEGVALYRTFIYLTHRHLVKTNATSLKEVEALFDEVFAFVENEFRGNEPSTIQLRKNYAYYLYAKLKNCDKARQIWKDIISKSGGGNTFALWHEAIAMERVHGDLANTRRLYYIALNSITDRPYDIFTELVQFEREEGTLDELDRALEKVNAQAKRLREIDDAKRLKAESGGMGGRKNRRAAKNSSHASEAEPGAVKPQQWRNVNGGGRGNSEGYGGRGRGGRGRGAFRGRGGKFTERNSVKGGEEAAEASSSSPTAAARKRPHEAMTDDTSSSSERSKHDGGSAPKSTADGEPIFRRPQNPAPKFNKQPPPWKRAKGGEPMKAVAFDPSKLKPTIHRGRASRLSMLPRSLSKAVQPVAQPLASNGSNGGGNSPAASSTAVSNGSGGSTGAN